MRLILSVTAISLLIGCAQSPTLPGTLTAADRAAPFPDLLPLARLRSPTAAPQITDDSMAQFDERLQRLRRRAAALAGPVVDPTTRSRMRAAIARAALR